MYANVRGIRSKTDSLQVSCEMYKPDIIIITETHLTGRTTVNIRNYKEKITRNRKTKGGGIMVAKRDDQYKINDTTHT